jgi:Protein of unknown function (DUF1678)
VIPTSNRAIGDAASPLTELVGLNGPDLEALARQGFLEGAYRFRGGRRLGPYFRLRWRRGTQQKTLYIGKDLNLAGQVQNALEELQRPGQLIHQVQRLLKAARRRIKKVKAALEPRLAEHGQHFHGYTARRSAKGESQGPRERTAAAGKDQPVAEPANLHPGVESYD